MILSQEDNSSPALMSRAFSLLKIPHICQYKPSFHGLLCVQKQGKSKPAHSMNKKIVAVKINRSYDTLIALYGKGAKWAMDFSKSAIIKALL